MEYKGVVQEFVGQLEDLDECELYLSISLAFMSIRDWIEANYFLKKASLLADEYRYELIVNNFLRMIIEKDYNEVESLLDARKYKYIKYELNEE